MPICEFFLQMPLKGLSSSAAAICCVFAFSSVSNAAYPCVFAFAHFKNAHPAPSLARICAFNHLFSAKTHANLEFCLRDNAKTQGFVAAKRFPAFGAIYNKKPSAPGRWLPIMYSILIHLGFVRSRKGTAGHSRRSFRSGPLRRRPFVSWSLGRKGLPLSFPSRCLLGSCRTF